jgi:predicted metal-binding protein
MPRHNRRSTEFNFLEKLAMDLGAAEAKVIPARDIVVEDRVVLKCQAGCASYGKRLRCPPYAPTVDQFRRMLRDYTHALLLKFTTAVEADAEVARSYLRLQYDPEAPKEKKGEIERFKSAFNSDRKRMNLAVLELEKAAFNKGYTLAVGFSGPCLLCDECNVKGGLCLHPTMARFPEHAVGINVKKTAKKAWMTLRFPFSRTPEPMALLLID